MPALKNTAFSISITMCIVLASLTTCGLNGSFGGRIIDHTATRIEQILPAEIERAKETLRIAYGHTSHGSQLVTGMEGIDEFLNGNGLYSFNEDGSDGALAFARDLGNYEMPYGAADLGNPDFTAWASATTAYLAEHPDTNVIIWSWCGQLSDASDESVNTYLSLMSGLEATHPDVRFVYMTGHTDGSGLEGQLHRNNETIRRYCITNDKWLYDFEDIESYDPDGLYFGDKHVNDACEYDSDGNGSLDANWAIEWQDAHEGEWFDCSPDHTQPVNGNLKGFAAWRLWASLALTFE